MIKHSYSSEYGDVLVEEYRKPFNENILQKIMSSSQQNLRDGYEENYLDTDNPASLGFLVRSDQLESVYFLYLDGIFKFFSATRILNDQGFMCLVRTFSSKEFGIKKPWHLSYLLGLQMMYAKESGFQEVHFTANVGVKDGVYKVIIDRYLNNRRHANSVKQLALANTKWFVYAGIRQVNYCDQHIFSAVLKDFQFP